jgi:putative Mg2+ transporter-C (MgtC) family protein
MLHYAPFDFSAFIHTTIALAVAFVLGGLIGFERQWRQRTAGLRTNVLVAVGAAAFVDLGMRVAGADGSVRVITHHLERHDVIDSATWTVSAET